MQRFKKSDAFFDLAKKNACKTYAYIDNVVMMKIQPNKVAFIYQKVYQIFRRAYADSRI